VEACRSGGAKEAQQWTEGSETGAEKIGRNCKKTKKNTETDRKVIQQNTKQKLEWRRSNYHLKTFFFLLLVKRTMNEEINFFFFHFCLLQITKMTLIPSKSREKK
jgi:hypothetical protein